MTTDNDEDDLMLPPIDDDIVSSGAAADSSSPEEELKALPRILRYAMLASRETQLVHKRLVAEIDVLQPRLPLNATWSEVPDAGLGSVLAAELDRLAVVEDKSELRSLSDCVRLLSLPVPRDSTYFGDHRRVAKALLRAFRHLPSETEEDLLAEIEAFCFGWAALPASTDLLSHTSYMNAVVGAAVLGGKMARHRIEAAEAHLRSVLQKEDEAVEKRAETEIKQGSSRQQTVEIPADHIVVARMDEAQLKTPKIKEIVAPLKSAINVALPLVKGPPLHEVRRQLLFEFPYASDAIDFTLADLVGRTTVTLRPLLLVGPPGGGKTRFVRALGRSLGVGVWRTDAARSDGAVFAGTDRRWYTAEPAHPFLAIVQARHANPLVLLDEVEKASTRSDYGRLWDCLLGFLEPETNARYPDPALQVTLDLSHVSYVATANSVDPLPSPIRDRFRVIEFPKPNAEHLHALLPAVVADLATERRLDPRWIEPLNGLELAAVARHWRGGSVRRVRRIVEAILRQRDATTVRN